MHGSDHGRCATVRAVCVIVPTRPSPVRWSPPPPRARQDAPVTSDPAEGDEPAAPASPDDRHPRVPAAGAGLAKGLLTTARAMLRPAVTAEYPHVKPALPPRSRGVIALLHENCTSCMLCARECPDWCIYIDSHKETVPATEPGGRDRQRNMLDRFAIDFSLCMYCGICIEACPFDALFWTPEFEYAEYDIKDLLHEKERLDEWAETIPAPPAHDPNGEPSKEEQRVAK
jgi:NADH-quinone oxidoreductase subunit I